MSSPKRVPPEFESLEADCRREESSMQEIDHKQVGTEKTSETKRVKEIVSDLYESKQGYGDKVQVYPGEEDKNYDDELEYKKEAIANDFIEEDLPSVEKEELVCDHELECKEEAFDMEPDDPIKDIPQKSVEEDDEKEIMDCEPVDSSPADIITKVDLETVPNASPLNTQVVMESVDIVIEEPEPSIFTTEQELFLNKIAPDVYASILTFDPHEEASRSCCSSCCLSICCQTCHCNLSCLLPGHSRKAPEMQKETLYTETLEKAAGMGARILKVATFPLVFEISREIWVSLELATVLIGLILSVLTFSFDNNEIFNIIHFTLSMISSALAIVDAINSLRRCRSCKNCYSQLKNEKNASGDDDDDDETDNNCLKCLKWGYDKMDVVRIIVTEILVYPLLICDIFEVIVGRTFESGSHSDRLGFALFLLSCISLLLYVYIVRVIILGRSIKRLQNLRYPKNQPFSEENNNSGPFSIFNGAFRYQIIFFIHVVFQMITQIMMLVAIGGKIRYDNRHFYRDDNSDEGINFSSQLIIMLVIGYIAPTFGYLSFFIVTKSWVQEFPLGIFNDIKSQLKLLESGGVDNFMEKNDDVNDKVKSKIVGMLGENYKTLSRSEIGRRMANFFNQFDEDYQRLREQSFFNKFEYPFRNPWMVVLCLGYFAMLSAFVSSAGVTRDDMGVLTNQVLNGGGWVIYYMIAVVFGIIANAYTFLVAAVWLIIIGAVIAVIIAAILCCVLVIVLFIAGAMLGSSDTTRTNKY